MHTTNLRKVGGSVMLAVPPALLEILHLRPAAHDRITVESGLHDLEPRPRTRYTLDQLLAQCDPKHPRTREDREWTQGHPAGDELL
mgnify:CR=1 FL=1